MDDEPQAELIHNLYNRDFPTDKLEESVIDYVLRCSKGVYKGLEYSIDYKILYLLKYSLTG